MQAHTFCALLHALCRRPHSLRFMAASDERPVHSLNMVAAQLRRISRRVANLERGEKLRAVEVHTPAVEQGGCSSSDDCKPPPGCGAYGLTADAVAGREECCLFMGCPEALVQVASRLGAKVAWQQQQLQQHMPQRQEDMAMVSKALHFDIGSAAGDHADEDARHHEGDGLDALEAGGRHATFDAELRAELQAVRDMVGSMPSERIDIQPVWEKLAILTENVINFEAEVDIKLDGKVDLSVYERDKSSCGRGGAGPCGAHHDVVAHGGVRGGVDPVRHGKQRGDRRLREGAGDQHRGMSSGGGRGFEPSPNNPRCDQRCDQRLRGGAEGTARSLTDTSDSEEEALRQAAARLGRLRSRTGEVGALRPK